MTAKSYNVSQRPLFRYFTLEASNLYSIAVAITEMFDDSQLSSYKTGTITCKLVK